MNPVITTLCLAALLAAFTPIRADEDHPKGEADASVKEALLTAGVGYKLDQDGNFHLNVKFKNGRHHTVVVISKTIQLAPEPDGDEMREIYAVAYVSNQAPSAELSALLLQENATAKIGGWIVRKVGDKFEVGFRGFIPAEVCEDELLPAVSIVANHADVIEARETNRDEN